MQAIHAAESLFAGARPATRERCRRGFPSTSPSSALSCSVLVLNRLYMAVHVVNVRRAFGLLCRELAEVIALEEGKFATYSFNSWREMSEMRTEIKQPEDDWIRAVNFEIQVPRVIRLLTFDRLPKQKVHLSRRNVFARDGHECHIVAAFSHASSEYRSCGSTEPRRRDHVGERRLRCVSCNVKKGGHTPYEAHMKLVRTPVRPRATRCWH